MVRIRLTTGINVLVLPIVGLLLTLCLNAQSGSLTFGMTVNNITLVISISDGSHKIYRSLYMMVFASFDGFDK